MNTQYLDDKTLQGLKNYVNSKLTKDVRATLLELKLKTGIDCFDDAKELKNALWRYAENELKQQHDVMTADYNNKINKGDIYGAGDIVLEYINKHYKKEWEIVTKFNVKEIQNHFNGICSVLSNNKIRSVHITVKELIEAININDYLDERLSKKSVDPELIKMSENILKELKNFNEQLKKSGKNYRQVRYAFDVYFDDKFSDTYLNNAVFHNLINEQ